MNNRGNRPARKLGNLAILLCLVLLFSAVLIIVIGSLQNDSSSVPVDQVDPAENLPPPEESSEFETAEYEPSSRLLELAEKNRAAVIETPKTGKKLEQVAKDISFSTERLLLYDVTHSQILYEKNAHELAYPASTTKLLTACVAAQYCDRDTVFTVGEELSFVAWDSSIAYLGRGEKLTFEQLIDGLLLPSGNDAAYVMAAGVGRIYAGDPTLSPEDAVEVFVDLMNQTAQKIGATESHFTCPDGYHDDDHYTSAFDMMKIAVYASSFETVRNSYAKYEAEHDTLTGESYYWENTNPLINPFSEYYYPYATGLKTGFTDEAGSCLVASAERDGVKLVAVALGGISIYERNQNLIDLFEAAWQEVL
ncbi:MAG: D-alanyl-D-alanine carboxypeptidase [Clostridia bacterium]|nr:D-alanyl-D-alanine carboxypeptidase [Clostridia bacterium]